MSGHPYSRQALTALALTTLVTSIALGAVPTLAASPAPSTAILLPNGCPVGGALPSGSIATVAGTGASGHTGDGGPALAAAVQPSSGTIAIDPDGALYFSDGFHGTVRRIAPDGTIETFASGFEFPLGLAVDAAGDIILADHLQLIHRIDPAGAVTTVAGQAVGGSTGNEGPATKAEVNPTQIAIGPKGDLYFDDSNNYRTIDPRGVIHAFAGSLTPGFAGDGGPALDALFGESVDGIAADAAGNVYLGDPSNHRIRKVDTAGIITTIAGTGVAGSSGDGGPASAAMVDGAGLPRCRR